jgi:hypothetical protein
MKLDAAGLLSKTDPHVSFSQDTLFDNCPAEWHADYVHGRKSKSIMLKVGGAVHKVAATINRGAWKSKDGIDEDTVKRAIRAQTYSLGDYGFFRRIHEGLTWVAQEANENHEHITGVEVKMSQDTGIRVPWSTHTVRVVGVPDRTSTHPKHGNEPAIDEYKTAGKPPTRREMEEDPQTNLYAELWRREKKYNGIIWLRWMSVLQKKVVDDVPVDSRAGEMAWEWVLGAVERMIRAVKANVFPATTYRRCGDCPMTIQCKAWQRERRALDIEGVEPTLAQYARLAGRAQALADYHERVGVHVQNRIEEAGGEMHEGGWRGEIHTVKGGLPERFEGLTTVEEFRAALTKPEHTELRVRRAR